MSKNLNDNQNKPNPEGGFNWRSFILVAIGIGLFSIILFNPLEKDAEKITYSEFKELLKENKVVLNEEKAFPFEVTAESPFSPTISGYFVDEPLVEWEGDEPFKLRFNPDLQLDEVSPVQENLVVETFQKLSADTSPQITLEQFSELVRTNALLVNTAESPLYGATREGEGLITGRYKLAKEISPEKKDTLYKKATKFKVSINAVAQGGEINKLFNDYDIANRQKDGTLASLLISFLPILILVALLFFFFRQQMKMSGKGPMSFGKSKARLLSMDKNKVTFKDVAGIQEAKEELFEIVDFLRDPKKFQNLGGTIPKGVLMVGSPGTGKTLLARAIAGEADVPFFSISGSDFVEMFVGVGASRVRDMFEQGRKNSPCLIFIDEIDAVGRHRGQGMGGGHDEREQTLNQLLVEMDGFDAQEGVIIIAATNRPDVLDPALLRPGRFDRQVTVSLPDVNGREEILKVHVKKVKLAEGVDLAVIARGTPGFSGAELANLINEAALLAARKGLKSISLSELEEARDKVRWGRERRSLALSEEDKLKTAYHEAGHSVLQVTLPNTDPIHKVTIIPRGRSLGSMMYLPERDKFSQHRNEMLDNLVVLMGGRVAEEIMLDDIANGAMGDISMATNIARSMVCEWGMSPELGMVEYKSSSDGYMPSGSQYSEAFAQKIDQEVKRFTDEAYQKATQILTEKKDKLELIAQALMEYETLEGGQIIELMETGEMQNPPSSPQPPELPDAGSVATPSPSPSDVGEGDGPFGGELVVTPA